MSPNSGRSRRYTLEAGTGHTIAAVTEEAPTVQLRRHLPATQDDLRDQLPGLEPERQITDWGRSERVESLADRLLYDFLYRYWFRVEVEGIENVPDGGGALLVANHAGAIPPDGAMIAKAIREEHPRARAVHVLTARRLTGIPGLGMLQTKLGRVAPHPANVHRLLADEGQLVLAFPEGAAATAKPVKERYRLRRFHSGGLIDAALRARVPLLPVAVLGAEEALPVFVRIPGVARLPRIPLGSPLPLPAKLRIRFLEPVDTAALDGAAWRDLGLVSRLTEDIRALIQENLLELVAERRSPWL
jgi:1-acyl-sn-glycerol-3-phosphate acyltransferase